MFSSCPRTRFRDYLRVWLTCTLLTIASIRISYIMYQLLYLFRRSITVPPHVIMLSRQCDIICSHANNITQIHYTGKWFRFVWCANITIRVQQTNHGKVFMSCWNDNHRIVWKPTVYWSSDNIIIRQQRTVRMANLMISLHIDRFKYETYPYHAEMVIYCYIYLHMMDRFKFQIRFTLQSFQITIILHWHFFIRYTYIRTSS